MPTSANYNNLVYNNGFIAVKIASEIYINAAKASNVILDDGDILLDRNNKILYFGNGVDTLNQLESKDNCHQQLSIVDVDESKTLKSKMSTILIKTGTNEAIDKVKSQKGYLKLGEPLYNLTNNTIQIGDGINSIEDLPIIGTSLIDAPNDGKVYVRSNNTWKSIKISADIEENTESEEQP